MEYSGNSDVQQFAEKEILKALACKLNMQVDINQSVQIGGMKLDGYVEQADETFLIEVWAHQGIAKTAQRHKLMNDACKLILVEKTIGKKSRKSYAYLMKSLWLFSRGMVGRANL